MKERQREKLVLIVLFSIVLVLWFMKTSLQQNLLESDDKVYFDQQKIKQLDTENMVLKEQLYPLQSLTVIDERARKLGLTPVKRMIYP